MLNVFARPAWACAFMAAILVPAFALGLEGPQAAAENGVSKGSGNTAARVLSDSDVQTYKKMFKLQRDMKRDAVVRLISKLDDKKILMGHLVAERLLHPRTRVPYDDLAYWLSRYHDHPQAWQIWRLANSRKPSGQTHRRPSINSVLTMAQYGSAEPAYQGGDRAAPSKARNEKLRELRRYRVRGAYSKSVTELKKKSVRKLLGGDTHMNVSLRLAQQMLNEGEFKNAVELAEHIEEVSPIDHPKALWIQGLAHYQMGSYETAGGIFREMTMNVSSKRSSYYTRSAYWAGRAYERLGRRSMAQVFFGMAAQSPLSFYGLLAHEELGTKPLLNWQKPYLNPDHEDKIFADEGIRRAIALTQIGEHEMAQHELKAAYSRIPYGYDESLLALALDLRLPAVSITLARNLLERGETYLAGLYPEPIWAPREGFLVDRALLFAIARQESAFVPNARSSAGARGLMQLMPATAKHIRDIQRKQRFSTHQLYEPAISLQLGQDYLMYLDKELSGNLLKMLAAYNAGPHNVGKWDDRGITEHDPVLFIERIPFSETRNYVKHVMANLWMYRQFGYGQSPTMANLANDIWPERSKAYAQLKLDKPEKLQ